MSFAMRRLADISTMCTGKLNSNAAEPNGIYPFFTCAQETYKINKAVFDTEAVILGGNNANGIFPLKYYKGEFNAYQRTYVIETIDPDILDTRFLFYSLMPALSRFQAESIGAATQYLTKSILDNFKIRVPELAIQKRIVGILAAYDDLIENNHRRIKLLEEAARQLYKEWFVHLRFPSHEHAKIKDGVPEGWEKKKISEICETVGGGTPSTKVSDYWNGDITWVVPSDITKNDCLILLDSERKITEEGLKKSSAKMVPVETILMTSRASVGYFALVDHKVCTNQGFINIIPHDAEWLLFNLMSRVKEIRRNAKGTTYPEISKGRFRDMDVIVPPDILMKEFSGSASLVVNQVRIFKQSISKLEHARDLLLPRLMKGEFVA